jgi:CubicO group peptidase (beta-lactamase class C family)
MSTFGELDELLRHAVGAVAPAIVCRVEQHGEALYEAAFGDVIPTQMAADQPNGRVSTETVFDLASLTKLFTSTACLRLCTEGALDLDMSVADILPDFGGVRPIGPTEDPITKLSQPASPYWRMEGPVDARRVTVRHLLTHTSGLPAWRNLFAVCGAAPSPGRALDQLEIARRQSCALKAIFNIEFAYPTGLSYLYSDVGLILLGAVVAAAHRQGGLDAAITDLVLAPLDLAACFNPPESWLDRIAPTEYCTWRGRRLQGEVHDENAAGLGGIAGHAGLFATASDVCRLGLLYLNGGEGLLSEDLVQESLVCQVASLEPGAPLPDPDDPCSTSNPSSRRGLGWLLQTPAGASCGPDWSASSFGHTGYTGTSLWCDPQSGLAVALLTNRVFWGRDPDPIHLLRQQVHTLVHAAVQERRNRLQPFTDAKEKGLDS